MLIDEGGWTVDEGVEGGFWGKRGGEGGGVLWWVVGTGNKTSCTIASAPLGIEQYTIAGHGGRHEGRGRIGRVAMLESRRTK